MEFSDTQSLLLAGAVAVGIRIILGRMLVPYGLPILREYRTMHTKPTTCATWLLQTTIV